MGQKSPALMRIIMTLPHYAIVAIFAIRSNQIALTIYLIETPLNAFKNRADLDQTAHVRAA